jgi:hypothetical protein
MQAVLYYIYEPLELNGSHINALEYFLTIFEHNPEIFLVLVNCSEPTKQKLIDIANNRYHLDDLVGWEDQMVCLESTIKLIRQGFTKVLVLDFYTIPNVKTLLHSKELIEIAEFTSPEHAPKNIEFQAFDQYNSKKLTIYGEMPWQQKDIEYRMKMMFTRFRVPERVTPGYYINSPGNPDKSYIKKLNLSDKPIFHKKRKHLTNMFEHFDEYIYYHGNSWFDPHPRLFVECTFYGKKIQYINEHGVKDGSYYRWKDINTNGVSGRILSKNDEIVRQFI